MSSREVIQHHQSSHESVDPKLARRKLELASSLHWFHWVIVAFSLLLTFFAWYYSQSSLESRVADQFEREANQVVELVLERMQKYEDALWGGVALHDQAQQMVDYDQWQTYANSLKIQKKYPGINGIGVIHSVTENELSSYLQTQRMLRPNFKIHPEHQESEYLPISYIIPLNGNDKAVGLDMAHEANRYQAAQKARDTGAAQITGPIYLVQDREKTPGFLFFAPFYESVSQDTVEQRHEHFRGMVYAPFVVSKLMQGALEKEKRHVGIRLTDGDQVLYDEHVEAEADYDPNPMFTNNVDVPLYGRTWRFDIWTAKSFREAATDNQPMIILVGGIFIDSLLVFLFLSISRASHKALGYADSMTYQLEQSAKQLELNQQQLAERATELEQSNIDLEQFAYVASHDLQEPLRKVTTFCQLLEQEYGEQLDQEGQTYIDYAVKGALRMRKLVTDLLNFSRVKTHGKQLALTDARKAYSDAIELLETKIEELNATVTVDNLPYVMADQSQLVSLFQNLISNALKYHEPSRQPMVHVSTVESGSEYVFCVEDNGIGIEEAYYDRVFVIFQRLHARDVYSGTGIGLAVCKRIVNRFRGRIWIESEVGKGSKFFFALPKIDQPQNGTNAAPEPVVNELEAVS